MCRIALRLSVAYWAPISHLLVGTNWSGHDIDIDIDIVFEVIHTIQVAFQTRRYGHDDRRIKEEDSLGRAAARGAALPDKLGRGVGVRKKNNGQRGFTRTTIQYRNR